MASQMPDPIMEQIARGAQDVRRIWRKRLDLLTTKHDEITRLIRLNDLALQNQDKDAEAHEQTVIELCRLRMATLEEEIYLLGKQDDIETFESDSALLAQGHHQEMATILLMSLTERRRQELDRLKLRKLKDSDSFGTAVSRRSYLAAEYRGSYSRPLGEVTPKADLRKKIILKPYSDELWEPILGAWWRQEYLRSVQFIPRDGENSYLRVLLNVANLDGFLMSAANSLLMLDSLEEAFKRGEFIIVPTGTFDDQNHMQFRCHVLKYANWESRLLDDIDGKILVFPKECRLRPHRKGLFLHALGAVLHCQRTKSTGWKEIWDDFFSGSMWASPGHYLERALLQATWDLICTNSMPQDLDRFLFQADTHAKSRIDILMFAKREMARYSEPIESDDDDDDRNRDEESDE